MSRPAERTDRDGPPPGRAALIRSGDRPRLNARLGHLLADAFPEYDVDDVDVLHAVRAEPRHSLQAATTGALEHAGSLVRGRIRPKRAFVTSSGFARVARRVVAARVSPRTHAFTFQSQSLFPVAVRGVPHFVYTDHAHLANLGYPGFDRSTFAGGRYLRREIEVYATASMVFTRSTHVRDVIVHGYGCPPDRVAVVGVGPNAEHHRSERGASWADGRIAFVGVDWERKGGPALLEAFIRLRATHPSCRLEIIGCEPSDANRPGVTVHGIVPVGDVAALLSECDVFCLPTRAEPFGVAFVEAMHAGLPVVGTDLGAVRDLVVDGDTGRLVPPDDVDALHQALRMLVEHPAEAQRMGARGQELARERYQWDVVMATIRSHIVDHLETAPVHPPTDHPPASADAPVGQVVS